MKSIRRMNQGELAAYVQSHLREKGIKVVLSGGAAVAIYTSNKYVSADIDLVDVGYVDRKKLIAAMEEIGFHEKNRYFIHPDTPQVVEFPPGPLSIGEEPIKQVSEIRFSTGKLEVISATDCVKDRLAAFYFWKDGQSLSQAVLVANDNPVDMNEVRRWSRTTDSLKDFIIFQEKLGDKSQ
jgi:hypothetical protein